MTQVISPSAKPRHSAVRKAPRKSTHNPNAIRRRIRLVEVTFSNQAHFEIYSMTRQGKAIEHHQEVDLDNGACQCSCEWFRFKLARLQPTTRTPLKHHCKHLQRAIQVLLRHDLLRSHLHSCDASVPANIDPETGEIFELDEDDETVSDEMLEEWDRLAHEADIEAANLAALEREEHDREMEKWRADLEEKARLGTLSFDLG